MSLRKTIQNVVKRGYHEVITEHFNKPKNISSKEKTLKVTLADPRPTLSSSTKPKCIIKIF